MYALHRAGWLRRDYQPVVTADVLDMDHIWLQAEVLRLRQGNRTLATVVRLLPAIVPPLRGHLDRRCLPQRTSCRFEARVLGLFASRDHRWRQAEHTCGLDDQPSCPRLTPTRLTAAESQAMKERVELPQYRHVPTGRLAILAQRLGKVFAAPATWYKLASSRGWRRPRTRLYPAPPKGRRTG